MGMAGETEIAGKGMKRLSEGKLEMTIIPMIWTERKVVKMRDGKARGPKMRKNRKNVEVGMRKRKMTREIMKKDGKKGHQDLRER